jgi:SAM-dependent methyltransferase
MDQIIKTLPSIPFGELNYCFNHGIMYQRDMNSPVDYDKNYFEDYVRKANTEIARNLNAGRTSITEKYCKSVLDIGIGSGEFIKSSNIRVFGFDINPVAIRWLRQAKLYCDPYTSMPEIDGVTFWDSLEHIPDPGSLLSLIRQDCYVFVSIPIISDLLKVRQSKHYKPNEHLYYFTSSGIIEFMFKHKFDIIEISDQETKAGREDILTFVFQKF